ncbi:MAG: hypothetical protein IJ236_08410 [Oscillospiraceae bacterium]|nr:hypothetical protein [Oscillospiraceae bacterium]
MTRREMERMLSLVDERYIEELCPDTDSPEQTEHFEAQPAGRLSLRRLLLPAAAVLAVVMIPAGIAFAGRGMQPEPTVQPGTAAPSETGTPADRMTDEEVAACFSMEYMGGLGGGSPEAYAGTLTVAGHVLNVSEVYRDDPASPYMTGIWLSEDACKLTLIAWETNDRALFTPFPDGRQEDPVPVHPGGYAWDFLGHYDEKAGFGGCDFYAEGVRYHLTAALPMRELLAMAFTLAGERMTIAELAGGHALPALLEADAANRETPFAGYVPAETADAGMTLTGLMRYETENTDSGRTYPALPALSARYENADHTMSAAVLWLPADAEPIPALNADKQCREYADCQVLVEFRGTDMQTEADFWACFPDAPLPEEATEPVLAQEAH